VDTNERPRRRRRLGGAIALVLTTIGLLLVLPGGGAAADGGLGAGALCFDSSACTGTTDLPAIGDTYALATGQTVTGEIAGATDAAPGLSGSVEVEIQSSSSGNVLLVDNCDSSGNAASPPFPCVSFDGTNITVKGFSAYPNVFPLCSTAVVAYSVGVTPATKAGGGPFTDFVDANNSILSGGGPSAAAGLSFTNSSGNVVDCGQITSTATTIFDGTTGDPVSGPLDVPADVQDVATVTSSDQSTPTGSVEFFLSTTGCNGQFTSIGTGDLTESGLAASPELLDLGAGSYAFKAVFSGSQAYSDSAGDCEPFTVGQPNEASAPTIAKTARGSYDDTFTWSIAKDASPAAQTIPEGSSANVAYTVSVSHGPRQIGNVGVDGTITLTNPNSVPIQIDGIADQLSDGTDCTVADGGAQSLPPGDTPFTYSCALSAFPAGAAPLTNTATVSWSEQDLGDGSHLSGGSAPVTSDPISFTAKEVDACVSVSDPLDPSAPRHFCAGDPGDPSFSFSYTHTYSGDPAGKTTTHGNTATFTTDDTATTGSASTTAKVSVAADLTVTEDATPSFTRTYAWDIQKSADPASRNVAAGGSASFAYAVSVHHDAGTDSGWQLTGTITVHNANEFEDIAAHLGDAVDNNGGGDCTVTPAAVTVPAGGDATATYSCSYPGSGPAPSAFTNTATATWDAGQASTPTGTASGTASGAFDAPTKTVDRCVSVTDSRVGALGGACVGDANPTTFTYSQAFPGKPGTCTDYGNMATFTTNDTGATGSAGRTITVCVGSDLTVSKTVKSTTFDRTYLWSITKSVDKTHVDQASGSVVFNYTVQVGQTGVQDRNWKVAGTITVTNPNDWEDIAATVSDSLSGCTFDTPMPVTVRRGGSVTIGYSCSSNGTSGTNTATATWDGNASFTPTGSASGTAPFAFTTPANTVNRTITVSDTYAGPLGSVTATDPPATPASATFTYSRTIAVVPNCVNYPNTATIVETGQSSSQRVTVCGAAPVPGSTGALTMGYWQNKNGQALIAAANQTALLAYLKGFNPFKDATAPPTTYTTNVIKAASAGGTTMNPMLKGQMLATALDVYFSDPALGGNKLGAPAPIGGVKIDLTNVSPIGNTSAAFGGATCLSVSAILSYAAGQSNAGGSAWYGNVKSTQELAKDVFDGINNQVVFAC
jgi:hypothetical protein